VTGQRNEPVFPVNRPYRTRRFDGSKWAPQPDWHADAVTVRARELVAETGLYLDELAMWAEIEALLGGGPRG
jgi:hypothetical protein